MTVRLRSSGLAAAIGLILLWCGAAVFLALWFSERVRDWSVMTDELQYAKLALAVAETHSPLPSLHDTSVPLANQLYALVLAPVYGSLSSPDAFRWAHVLNAVVMTSAIFPTYLLARQLVDRAWSFAVAALAIVVPWMVLTGFVMSEVVAYPAFLWAIFAFQSTVAAPSGRRDVLAVVALGIAILARTQFAALVLVLPLTILCHELGRAVAADGLGRRGLGSGVRSVAGGHRALWSLYAAGAVVATGALLAGHRLFGAYETAVQGGSLLPAAAWWSALEHLAVVGIGCGVVPLVVGGGWMLASLLRPSTPSRRAFATLGTLAIAALSVETASFDLRFGGVIRDRYLFYVVPLLLVASAAALTEKRRTPVALGAVVVTAAFAVAARGLPFPIFPRVEADTPVSVVDGTLAEWSGTLTTGTFVSLALVLLGGTIVLLLLLLPRLPVAVVLFASVLASTSVVLRTEVERMLDGGSVSGRPLAGPPGVVLDWVDSVVPEGESAALVSFPVSTDWGSSAIRWWDIEFWNRTVTRAYAAPDGNWVYTPFPRRTLEIDPATGVFEGTADAPAYVVVAPGDPRFGLAGQTHAENVGLRVLAVDRPYRATWSSRRLQTDGWTTPGVPASIRVYGRPGAAPDVERVRITVVAPRAGAAAYRVATETAHRSGAVAAGSPSIETVFVCVAPGRPVDVTVTASSSTLAGGPPLGPEPEPPRRVGVGIGAVEVTPTRQPCGER